MNKHIFFLNTEQMDDLVKSKEADLKRSCQESPETAGRLSTISTIIILTDLIGSIWSIIEV